jgi:hypothetical protein
MKYQRCATVLLLAFCAFAAVQAQSGRHQVKPPPSAPVPTPTPEATPPPKKETKQSDLAFSVGADRNSSYGQLPFTYYDAVVQGCASRLREGSSASVDMSDRDVSRGEAIKKAKSETKTYTVWLNLQLDSMAQSYDDLVLEYTVYAPETAKVVTSGRTYLRGQRAGPIVVNPGSRGSGLYREELLKRTGEEAGDRILKALHLDVQVPPN